MSDTAVFKVCVRGRGLSRENALARFREAAGSAGLVLEDPYEPVVRTFPPLAVQRNWPDWMPDPVWTVVWKLERVV